MHDHHAGVCARQRRVSGGRDLWEAVRGKSSFYSFSFNSLIPSCPLPFYPTSSSAGVVCWARTYVRVSGERDLWEDVHGKPSFYSFFSPFFWPSSFLFFLLIRWCRLLGKDVRACLWWTRLWEDVRCKPSLYSFFFNSFLLALLRFLFIPPAPLVSSAGPRRTYVSLEDEICGKTFAVNLAFIPSSFFLSDPPPFYSSSFSSAGVLRWAMTYVSLEDEICGKMFAVSLLFLLLSFSSAPLSILFFPPPFSSFFFSPSYASFCLFCSFVCSPSLFPSRSSRMD